MMATNKLGCRDHSGNRMEDEISSAGDNSDCGDEGSEPGNAGWADSIAKVLNTTKPKSKKTIVLSRAKKLKPKSKPSSTTEKLSFEIDGEIKVKPNIIATLKDAKKLKNQLLPLRVRPSIQDLNRERCLRKVATRGVVQLFNAIRLQQQDLENQLQNAGRLDSKRDAVLNNINKSKFLDILMGGNQAKSESIDNQVKCEDEDDGKGKIWSVLRPDYMTNKKLKHWDEESTDGSENNEISEEDE